MVNNLDMPKGQKGSKFSSVGMGEFSRVPPSKSPWLPRTQLEGARFMNNNQLTPPAPATN